MGLVVVGCGEVGVGSMGIADVSAGLRKGVDEISLDDACFYAWGRVRWDGK